MSLTPQTQQAFLIVDDEPDILDAVARLFRRDYKVFTAPDVRTAFSILERETVQVVLSDQRMPELSGVEFLAKLRRAYPDVVRILVTGYSNIDHVVEAINEGHVYRYITKPWNPAELKVFVAQAFDYYEVRRERELLVESLRRTNDELERHVALLREANEDLKTLDRMKTVFMEVVSHELNTPTAVILGYSSLLERASEDETVKKGLAGIRRSGERLRNIAQRIFKVLASGDARTLEKRHVPLAAFLEELRTDVRPFLSKRQQTLAIEIGPEADAVTADREKLHDILLNVLMNAIKFSPDGQEILIRTWREDDSLKIAVRDQGVGIAAEDLNQIFDAFFSSFSSQHHSSGEFEFGKRGIGLGLSVAQHFARLHGGEITVDSVPGGGSTFTVILPHPTESSSAEESSRPAPRAAQDSDSAPEL